MASLNLKQRRALDLVKEQLVPAAEQLLERGRVVDLESKHFGQAQLRNLIAVALDTESPAVVFNFIRYQMGRDGKSRNAWAKVPTGLAPARTLGELFLEELEADSGTVATALAGLAGELPTAVEKQLARIELVRQFLGFASRYMKFIDLRRGGNGRDGNHDEDEP